jgi:hypothetical protein
MTDPAPETVDISGISVKEHEQQSNRTETQILVNWFKK